MLISFSCPAAEIVAWKVPLENYVWQGIKAEGIVRLQIPPEPSPFFGPTDELWDLGGVPTGDREDPFGGGGRPITDPPLEWAVWNASTRRLVTKGEWLPTWQLYQTLGVEDLLTMCRITLDVCEVKPAGSPPDAEAVPVSQLSWVSRSGTASEAFSSVRDHETRAKAEAIVDHDLVMVVLSIHATAAIPNNSRIEIETSVTLVPGVGLWLARDVDGMKGIDFRVTARIELLDGTPFEERVMIQKGEGIQPFIPYRGGFESRQINDHQWLATTWVDRHFVEQRALLRLDKEDLPKDFIESFEGPIFNLRGPLIAHGLITKDSLSITGFNPLIEKAFLLTRDPEELKRFELLIGGFEAKRQIAVSLEGGTQKNRLVGHSGRTIKFSRFLDDNKSFRHLEAEPLLDSNIRHIDLNVAFREGPAEAPHRSGEVRLTVESGVPVEVMAHQVSGESPPSLVVKAEVVGPSGEAEEAE